MGAPKGYNPKNKGKKSFQPILTFMAETHEYIWGELRNGDLPDGKQIARHLQSVCAALPQCIQTIFARADSSFYCWEAVEAYQKAQVHLMIVARKTSRMLERLQTADWKRSRKKTPTSSANSGISPKVGVRPSALSPCATRRRRTALKSTSSINECS
jgi:hypothetical protein